MKWLVEHLDAELRADTPASPSLTYEGEPPRVCLAMVVEAETWGHAREYFVDMHCPGLDPYHPRFRCSRVV